MLFDRFDEPLIYYRRLRPMRSGLFDYMSRWMNSVDRMMEREFGTFYDSFYDPYNHSYRKSIDNKSQTQNVSENKEEKKEIKKEENQDTSAKEDAKPIKNRFLDDSEYYCVTTSMYSGSDGTQHIYREEHDSNSGKHKVVETRRIGNKSMTLHRVTDRDGHIEEHETRKNIKDEEVEDFKNQWNSRNMNKNQGIEGPKEEKIESNNEQPIQNDSSNGDEKIENPEKSNN